MTEWVNSTQLESYMKFAMSLGSLIFFERLRLGANLVQILGYTSALVSGRVSNFYELEHDLI